MRKDVQKHLQSAEMFIKESEHLFSGGFNYPEGKGICGRMSKIMHVGWHRFAVHADSDTNEPGLNHCLSCYPVESLTADFADYAEKEQ